jgi:hypothetical protein
VFVVRVFLYSKTKGNYEITLYFSKKILLVALARKSIISVLQFIYPYINIIYKVHLKIFNRQYLGVA